MITITKHENFIIKELICDAGQKIPIFIANRKLKSNEWPGISFCRGCKEGTCKCCDPFDQQDYCNVCGKSVYSDEITRVDDYGHEYFTIYYECEMRGDDEYYYICRSCLFEYLQMNVKRLKIYLADNNDDGKFRLFAPPTNKDLTSRNVLIADSAEVEDGVMLGDDTGIYSFAKTRSNSIVENGETIQRFDDEFCVWEGAGFDKFRKVDWGKLWDFYEKKAEAAHELPGDQFDQTLINDYLKSVLIPALIKTGDAGLIAYAAINLPDDQFDPELIDALIEIGDATYIAHAAVSLPDSRFNPGLVTALIKTGDAEWLAWAAINLSNSRKKLLQEAQRNENH